MSGSKAFLVELLKGKQREWENKILLKHVLVILLSFCSLLKSMVCKQTNKFISTKALVLFQLPCYKINYNYIAAYSKLSLNSTKPIFVVFSSLGKNCVIETWKIKAIDFWAFREIWVSPKLRKEIKIHVETGHVAISWLQCCSCVLKYFLCLLTVSSSLRHSQRAFTQNAFVYIFPGEDFREFSLCKREQECVALRFGSHHSNGEKRRNSRENIAAKKLFHPRCGHFPFFLHLEQMGRKMWKKFFNQFSSQNVDGLKAKNVKKVPQK